MDDNATHSEVTEEVRSALEMFDGLPDQPSEKNEESQETPEPEKEEAPPIEPEPKGITVKYNKEDHFIEEQKIPEYARKGLNYDKVETRAKDYEMVLDRVAKQQGFKDHADLIANLDRIEQQQILQRQQQFQEIEQNMFDELVNAGVAEDVAKNYLANNPAIQENRKFREQLEQEQQQKQKETEERNGTLKWSEFFTAYPELEREYSESSTKGETAAWITPEFSDYIYKGYHPTDAYKLANMHTLTEQARKQAEQKAIKDRRLGLRSQVETDAASAIDDDVPDDLKSAFSLFGLDPKAAKKYVK